MVAPGALLLHLDPRTQTLHLQAHLAQHLHLLLPERAQAAPSKALHLEALIGPGETPPG